MTHTVKKTVRFSTQLETINYTYSDAEYDRSSPLSFFFSSRRPASATIVLPAHPPPPRKKILLNDAVTINTCGNGRPTIAPLDLSGIPNACRRTLSVLDHTSIAKTNKEKKLSAAANCRPKLFIDTSGAGTGPRFFTSLSTHYKCRSDDDSGSEPSSAYFTPISPIC